MWKQATKGSLSWDSPCMECGYILKDKTNRGEFLDHMENAHGYVRLGNSVYKRRVCAACGKPALYRSGGLYVCKDHRSVVVESRVILGKNLFEAKNKDREKLDSDLDKFDLRRRRYSKTKKSQWGVSRAV